MFSQTRLPGAVSIEQAPQDLVDAGTEVLDEVNF